MREREPPLGHVAGDFDQHFDLQRHVAATVELHGDVVAVADEFGAAVFDRELLHRHVVAEQRNGLAGFRGGKLQRHVQQRHAVVHRAGITGGNDGGDCRCRL